MSDTGLYKPKASKYWWMRFSYKGRKVRRTTGYTDIGSAKESRRAAMMAFKRLIDARAASESWAKHVDQQAANSVSWLRRTHRRIVAKSRNRGWSGVMSFEELRGLMLASQGVCELTGLPFTRTVGPAKAKDPYAISIDRIDSRKGYTVDNCRLVLLGINLAMQQWGEQDLVKISRALVDRASKDADSGHE